MPTIATAYLLDISTMPLSTALDAVRSIETPQLRYMAKRNGMSKPGVDDARAVVETHAVTPRRNDRPGSVIE